MVVLFEGIDTCGKTTQIELLSQRYPHFVTTKEPSERFREILLSGKLTPRALMLLFVADRAQHYADAIKPNCDKTIISDRGLVSGMAYALSNETLDIDWLLELNRYALHEHLPDKIVLFTTTYETLKERLATKTLDGIEQKGLEYLLNVQANMLRIVRSLNVEYRLIDANETIEAIHQQLMEFITTLRT